MPASPRSRTRSSRADTSGTTRRSRRARRLPALPGAARAPALGEGGGTRVRHVRGRVVRRHDRERPNGWLDRCDYVGRDTPGPRSSTTRRRADGMSRGKPTNVQPVNATHCDARFDRSVPARNPWAVTDANNTKLERWIECQTRRGSHRMSQDVTSIATSRYIARIPQATARVRHALAKGTKNSLGPNFTNESAHRPTR